MIIANVIYLDCIIMSFLSIPPIYHMEGGGGGVVKNNPGLVY